jgi:hypothetical protein
MQFVVPHHQLPLLAGNLANEASAAIPAQVKLIEKDRHNLCPIKDAHHRHSSAAKMTRTQFFA